MKLTKTLTLAAIVAAGLLAGSTALQAQDAPPANRSGMHGRPNIDQIAKDLNLTDDQKTQFKAAFKDQQTKMKALRSDTSVSKEDRKAKAREIREATQTKIKEILTPEQFKKFREEIQHHRKANAEAK